MVMNLGHRLQASVWAQVDTQEEAVISRSSRLSSFSDYIHEKGGRVWQVIRFMGFYSSKRFSHPRFFGLVL